MAVSNNITALLSFISFICSIPILAAGIWLSTKPDTSCIHALRPLLLVLPSLALVVSLCGFLGAFYKKRGLLAIYLFAMAALITCLLILVVLASVVTRPSGGYMVPGRGYHEYRLEGFSKWLRDHVVDDEHWGNIRACLSDSEVCSKMSRGYFSDHQFYWSRLSPIESGCCKPPTICGYQYVNPIMWVSPTNAVSDPDCLIWNNDPSLLCYHCDSCKAGLLGNLRSEWRKAEVAVIVAIVVLIFVYLIACNAHKNTKVQRYK